MSDSEIEMFNLEVPDGPWTPEFVGAVAERIGLRNAWMVLGGASQTIHAAAHLEHGSRPGWWRPKRRKEWAAVNAEACIAHHQRVDVVFATLRALSEAES